MSELCVRIRRSTCGTYSRGVSPASIRVNDRDGTSSAAVLEALTATLWSAAAKVKRSRFSQPLLLFPSTDSLHMNDALTSSRRWQRVRVAQRPSDTSRRSDRARERKRELRCVEPQERADVRVLLGRLHHTPVGVFGSRRRRRGRRFVVATARRMIGVTRASSMGKGKGKSRES